MGLLDCTGLMGWDGMLEVSLVGWIGLDWIGLDWIEIDMSCRMMMLDGKCWNTATILM